MGARVLEAAARALAVMVAQVAAVELAAEQNLGNG
jgi:hypothetical protein